MADRPDPQKQTEVLAASARVNGAAAEATLSGGELAWRPPGGGEGRRLELESEVLGCRVEGRKLKLATFSYGGVDREMTSALVCGGGKGGGARDGRTRRRREVVVEMESEDGAARWDDAVRDRLASLGRPKRLFIIVNPYGGKKSGRSIFQTEVLPLIEAAGILYTMQGCDLVCLYRSYLELSVDAQSLYLITTCELCLETKHRFDAQELSHSLDLMKYDGIICVSGDGVLVEVVNGLLQREDWETAIKVPLGIIPAGTGNGMAQSLLHAAGESFSIANAVFAIIRGHKRALDVTSVVQGKTRFFSVLMLTWGLVADVDIESEKYRWMGSARLEFYFLVRVLNLRRYNGRVLFVPAPGYEEFGDPVEASTSCASNGAVTGVHGDRANDSNGETLGYPGPSIQEADLQWRSLTGPFVSVWLGNVPFASEDAMTAPKAEFSDGYLDAAIIRDCPRWDVLGLLFQMKDGAYLESPYVEYFKVKAIRIEPGTRVGSSSSKGGIIDSDGEVLARGDGSGHLMAYGPPVELTVDRGLATIFSPR